MKSGFKEQITVLPSSFGDTGVRVSRLFPDKPDGTHALLLHGVHSSANLEPKNKFRHLAFILAERGITPWLCETSRISVAREECGVEISAWIEASFGGKNFGEERDDCLAALRLALAEAPRRLWLWGFSLGGIIALLLARLRDVRIEKLILAGTGLFSMPDTEKMLMSLPVLSTLRAVVSENMLDEVRADEAVIFRGSEDSIFSEEACLSLLDALKMPKARKRFFSIRGADHSLKTRGGKYDPTIMDEMLSLMENL